MLPSPSIRCALIAAALLSACGGPSRPAARASASTATCAEAAAAIDARAHGGSLLALGGALAPLAPYYRSLAAEVEVACTAGTWSPEVRGCMVAATSDADLRTCEDVLSLEQRRTLAARIARVTDQRAADDLRDQMCACDNVSCAHALSGKADLWGKAVQERYPRTTDMPVGVHQAMEAMDACLARYELPDGNGGDDPYDYRGFTGVPACDAFLELQDRYFACDKVPQQAREAMEHAMDQQKQAWSMLKDPNVPAEALKAAADGCRQGGDALRQSAHAMGCPL